MHYKTNLQWLLAGVTLVALGGCGGDDGSGEGETAEAPSSPQMIARQAPRERDRPTPEPSPDEDFRVVPDVTSQSDEDGLGLETIINASSKRAYADSMRWIAEDVSTEQLRQLEQSIRFVHMYDSSVFGSEQRLLEYLDGKTGREIIERAQELRQSRSR